MNRSAAVAAELGLRLVVPERGGVPLTASLRYRCDDPYAIRMSFHIGMDDPVEWLFALPRFGAAGREPNGAETAPSALTTNRPGSNRPVGSDQEEL